MTVEAVRGLAVRTLKDAGYAVIEASGGEEAARIAEPSDAPIDLVVSDVIMPGVRGGTLVADVRSTHPGARVLFMTGFADPGTLAALDGQVLNEPFTPRELLARVRAVLDDPGRDPA